MTQTNAFPSYLVVQDIYGQKFHSPQGGLTRRDCFASQIYASLVAADKKTSPNYSEMRERHCSVRFKFRHPPSPSVPSVPRW